MSLRTKYDSSGSSGPDPDRTHPHPSRQRLPKHSLKDVVQGFATAPTFTHCPDGNLRVHRYHHSGPPLAGVHSHMAHGSPHSQQLFHVYVSP
eukprot:6461706-Amphidinium_carterae.2